MICCAHDMIKMGQGVFFLILIFCSKLTFSIYYIKEKKNTHKNLSIFFYRQIAVEICMCEGTYATYCSFIIMHYIKVSIYSIIHYKYFKTKIITSESATDFIQFRYDLEILQHYNHKWNRFFGLPSEKIMMYIYVIGPSLDTEI